MNELVSKSGRQMDCSRATSVLLKGIMKWHWSCIAYLAWLPTYHRSRELTTHILFSLSQHDTSAESIY